MHSKSCEVLGLLSFQIVCRIDFFLLDVWAWCHVLFSDSDWLPGPLQVLFLLEIVWNSLKQSIQTIINLKIKTFIFDSFVLIQLDYIPTVVNLQLNCNCDHSNTGLSDITLGQQTDKKKLSDSTFFLKG